MTGIKVKVLTGFDKTRGLLGTKKAYPVFFHTRFGIHTFGLKFPIDVVIVDRRQIVVKIAKNLKPNRIFLWNPFYDNVLELPEHAIAKNNIRVGEVIRLIFS